MSTLLEIMEMVARDLRDPDGVVFDELTLRDLINSAIVDVNRVAPMEMAETIPLVADTLEYPTRISEAKRLELWDFTLVPPRAVSLVRPASANPVNSTDVGWEIWDGMLRVPYWMVQQWDVTKYELKLWGWGKRLPLVELDDDAELDEMSEWAVREAAVLGGYSRLEGDRSLFTQWNALPNNTDVSNTQLLNALSFWQGRWERRRRQIMVIRFPQ